MFAGTRGSHLPAVFRRNEHSKYVQVSWHHPIWFYFRSLFHVFWRLFGPICPGKLPRMSLRRSPSCGQQKTFSRKFCTVGAHMSTFNIEFFVTDHSDSFQQGKTIVLSDNGGWRTIHKVVSDRAEHTSSPRRCLPVERNPLPMQSC